MRICLLAMLLTLGACRADRPVYRPSPDPGPPPTSAATKAQAPPGTAARAADPHRQARGVWIARCGTCHGPTGRGDGPASRLIRPRPANFADAGWQTRAADAAIERIIVEGGAAMGRSASMPASPDLAGPRAKALVKLIRSFQM